VIWSNTAFNIYMGDAMAQEPEASRDRDVVLAEAPRDRDVMLASAVRDSAIENAGTCDAAVEARRSGSFVARGARG
jgi:hypothetical protein